VGQLIETDNEVRLEALVDQGLLYIV